MNHAISARLFTLLSSGVVLVRLALVAGAPWGALTQGGRAPGTLPGTAREVAFVSAALLAWFIHVIRARAGSPPRFGRTAWIVVAYCALGMVANAATPSVPERVLWLPVVTLMFATSLHVALRSAPTGAA